MNSHPNSKVVEIKRKISLGDYNQKEIEEIMGESARPIGAYWLGRSLKPGCGLTPEEQDLIMPHIIMVEPDDKDFRKKVEEYFHDINTKVPKEGIKLEIGLEKDNDKPVSKGNLPLNPMEFVAYRHALGHPQVAKNKFGATSVLVKWYMEDAELELSKEKSLLDLKDEAAQLYLANKDNTKMVNMVLELSGVKTTDNKKVLEFKKLSETKPAKFKELLTDKDIQLRYLVSLAIGAGILKRVGDTTIVWTESGETIGRDMLEVIVYLRDPKKTPEVNKIKAALKNFED